MQFNTIVLLYLNRDVIRRLCFAEFLFLFSQLTALLRINNTNLRFQLDTGADIHTINKHFVRPEQNNLTQKMLTIWNKIKLKPEGKIILNVTNAKNSMTHFVKFVVVDDSVNCLLGLQTVQMMNLVSVNAESFIAKLAANDVLGNLRLCLPV